MNDFFNDHFQIGSFYSNAQIRQILQDHGSDVESLPENVTALTYNRWNIGQNRPYPYFIHTNRNEYQYLGPDSDYIGPCYHYPQGERAAYLIGNWTNGEFHYADPEVDNFQAWVQLHRENPTRNLIAVEGAQVKFEAIEMALVQVRHLSLECDGTSVLCLLVNSPLGQLIYGLRIGETFVFGKHTYTFTSISY
jgi:hypothetical protein